MAADGLALAVDMPNNVTIAGETGTVKLILTNTGDSHLNYDVSYYAPFGFSVSNASGTLSAGSSKIVRLIIADQPGLQGQKYSTMLQVDAGGETTTKRLGVEFKGAEKGQNARGITGGSAFFTLACGFALENALNIVLGFIAAILLIAFIARFVKRLEEMQG